MFQSSLTCGTKIVLCNWLELQSEIQRCAICTNRIDEGIPLIPVFGVGNFFT